MHDPLLVCVFESERRLASDLASIGDGQPVAGFRQRVEVAAFDVFHGEEVCAINFAGIGRLHDCRMTELSDDAHLTLEARDGLFIDETSGWSLDQRHR